ncbi:RIP metalloprotease RseP [Ruminococcaceae bacterium KH2T8]|nr:RIP metalloprotease RseP [Ruminococcaceae bacterium KH2T8]
MNISIWSIITVILMLGLLVTVHELGHFWMACFLKIKAYEVSIFIGPKLFSWKRKGVDYSIRALPFGAYVRFTDFDDQGNAIESDDPELLINQKRWKRLLVAIAGPFMNAVLGVLIFAIMNCVSGYTSLNIGPVSEGTQLAAAVTADSPYQMEDRIVKVNGDRVFTYLDFFYELDNGVREDQEMVLTLRSAETHELYEITLVPELTTRPMLGITYSLDTIEEYQGWEIYAVSEQQNGGNPILKEGDILREIDGKPVIDEDFEEYFANLTEGDTMHLTFERDGEIMEEDCLKTMITVANSRGVRLIAYDIKSAKDFFGAVKTAAMMPATIGNITVRAIGDVFEGEEEVYNMVSGPVGVTSVVSEVVDDQNDTLAIKIVSVIQLAGIISIGLVFTNMLPIPGLDGVQVILIIVEMVIGHKLSKKSETVINGIGFVMLIALMIFAFASDIIRIIVGG